MLKEQFYIESSCVPGANEDVKLDPLTFLFNRLPLVERFGLDENMQAAVERHRVGVDGMKLVVKCEGLVDEVCKQDVG